MPSAPEISIAERRRRLVARHALDRSAEGPLEAVRAVVALHSSDPITPHLSLWARVRGFTTGDLDGALCEARSLWRLHAMRRTLFVVPRDEAPAFLAGAAVDIAAAERRRLERWLAAELPAEQVDAWIAALEGEVRGAVAAEGEALTKALNASVPGLSTEITLGSGKWKQRAPVGSRLLFLMAMEGDLVRTRPGGSWRSSQYHWAEAAAWFSEPVEVMSKADASAALLRRYLARFGPVTFEDVRWWTGWTVKQARAALAAIEAVTVALEGGGEGLVLPEDLDDGGEVASTAALLPGLDPTPMGWKDRGWYLGPHAGALFDKNGNVGPTLWWGGRIVGGWAQRADGEVTWRLLESAGREAERGIEDEAEALTRWLGGASITPRFRTPLERELASDP